MGARQPDGEVRGAADLHAVVRRFGDQLRCEISAWNGDDSPHLLQPALLALAADAAANPDSPISCLALIGAEDRDLLDRWNRTDRPLPDNATVHGLFERQVARTPLSIAATDGDRTFTYRELNASANRLARLLHKIGAIPGEPVGLCLNRSTDTLIALLAVLKAGHPYLPLDPHYPAARIHHMVTDSRTPLLLTERSSTVPISGRETSRLALEDALELAANEDDSNPEPSVGPDDLAYVMYTSGTTGSPKGVEVEHRSAVNLLLSLKELVGLDGGDHLLSVTSLSFDISVFELLGPLAVGARLTIARDGETRDGRRLGQLLETSGATIMQATPTTWRMLLNTSAPPPALKIMCGGEPMPSDLARDFLGHTNDVWNVYGPTETTVWSTAARIDNDDLARPPVGTPLANTRVYVLDRYLQPLPIGATGELYIGGLGVTRGYRNRPELSAERFLKTPWDTDERLYRTGDLARFLSNGRLELLGRVDNQVKISGHRIETGEIEACLRSVADVRDAVVTVEEGGHGPELTAYVVWRGAERDTARLRSALSVHLPVYMLPARYTAVESIPVLPNGKLDRASLVSAAATASAAAAEKTPEPARVPVPAGENAVLPQAPSTTPLQEAVAGHWQELLGARGLGPRDDFFALGGSSLKAGAFVNRLEECAGQTIFVSALFDHPTLAGFCAFLEAEYPETAENLTRGASGRTPATDRKVDADRLRVFRDVVTGPRPVPGQDPRLAPAAFVLSAPRSGSTLLRVMLAGSARLFAPPELDLLGFDSMRERAEALNGRNAHDGLQRALVELLSCSPEEACLQVEDHDRHPRTRDVYATLQGLLGERLLVDKTTTYAMDPSALKRAEQVFDGARYIHLIRHPAAMIHSYESIRLEQVFRHRFPHSSSRELAELIWLASNSNVESFFRSLPEERRMVLRFEDLLAAPEERIGEVADFLGVGFDPLMAAPYSDLAERMADGLHPVSRMAGDPKFTSYDRIRPEVNETWRGSFDLSSLSPMSRFIANRHGYDVEPRLPAPRSHEPRRSPVSAHQRGIYLHQQVSGERTLYNICKGWRIRGALEPLALGAALDHVVRHHAALRGTIRLVDGEPTLFTEAAARAVIDHIPLSEGASESEIAKALEEYAATELDLENGPTFRAGLLRIDDRDHVLVLLVHHALIDGSSLAVVLPELADAYRAAASGSVWSPPSAVQHVDLLDGGEVGPRNSEKDMAYWQSALEQAPPVLTLPSTRERPSVRSYRGARVPMRLAGDTWKRLLELARSTGATPFITLLAAFKALMRRYNQASENNRVMVGTAFAGRRGADGVVGMFTGTLPLITGVDDDVTFQELLAEVRRSCSHAFEHHDVSFDALIDRLGGVRDASLPPLLQVLFTLEPQLTEKVDLPSLELEDVDITWRTSKFDLTVSAVASEDHLSGWWEYDRELFDPEWIHQAADHYVRLLGLIADDPDRAIGDYDFLSPEEHDRAVREWNSTARDWEGDEPLETAIRRHALAAPDAVAVEGAGQRMTYGQLDASSDELAVRLQAEGLEPGHITPVLTDRSPAFAVACLAVMKCGAAYLPIDPSTPDERIIYIIRDSGARIAVTTANQRGRVPDEVAQLRPDHIDRVSVTPEKAPVSGTDPAYVIYTSGSTGQPKGVVVGRHGLENFVRWYSDELRLSPDDTCVQAVNLGFDAAVMDLWPTLASGATLTIAPDAALTDPAGMWEWLARTGATVGFIVTPVLEAMLAEPRPPIDRISLRTVVTGGDRLHPQRMDDFPFRLVNGYGPTETTILATTAPVPSSSEDPRTPSIGRPVPNTTCYVLDRRMRPVPVGVEGELYIGGAQVALGYLNRPELTRERFLPDPFDGSFGARLFRSGDRVRQRPDGTLDFLGRMDDQVKIRGFRIELGEIESALVQVPGVREAAVTVAGSGAGQRLHAFVVGSESITRDTVCDELGRTLPAYMLPTAVVRLDGIPRTRNGKTDRRALAELAVPVDEEADDEPSTELEARLLALWRRVLDRDDLRGGDSFFEFGGHSLNAMRLLSELHEETGHELTIPELFNSPSPRAVARALGNGDGRNERTALVELRSGENSAPLVCTHPSDGSVLHYQPFEELCGPRQAVWALRALPHQEHDSVEAMAEAYLDEIRAKSGKGSRPHLLGWSFGGLVTFEMARLLEGLGEPPASVVLLDSEPLTGETTLGEKALLAEFSRQLSRRSGSTETPAPTSWSELFALAREHRWIEPSVRERELRNAFSTFRHHVEIGRRYKPEPISTPLHVYIASERDQELRDAQREAWESLGAGGLSLVELAGDHFDAVSAAHLAHVAKDLGLAGETVSGED
ncbi:non-ribosomal peptide synthetase [Nocardiopsis valliformis]|uniref:non-ribosomal peptide synthetase n=1 Tax=Nocardiopsis valliformis TaxID=239974 RepID=UPI001360B628|nr:non-ribosomal peptide synthetase [Nocardiopsis valliformis]